LTKTRNAGKLKPYFSGIGKEETAMHYESMVPGIFLERPNRFLARVQVGEKTITSHVKNTGRCKELLIPGAQVFLQYHPDAKAAGRKTEYSLINVYKEMAGVRQLVNLDSQAPNQVAWEWLLKDPKNSQVRREVRFGASRFDLAFVRDEKLSYMEVKGVTLEVGGTARFPDAPTERGIKHLKELEAAAGKGFPAYVLFVIAMKGITCFEPNRAAHPEFADALAHAVSHGVKVLARDCIVKEDSLVLDQEIPVVL